MQETFTVSDADSKGGGFSGVCFRNHFCDSRKLSPYYMVVLFLFLLFLGYLTSIIDDSMPAVVNEEDAGLTKFSEQRAWLYLQKIVGSGPRVAGTKYHLEKTRDLKNLLDEVQRNATQKVLVDWQVVSGGYWIGFKSPFANIYNNLSNIVAVLEGDSGLNYDGTTNSSIIFNCHYDSVPTSPGASDNALFCAAMVEVLSILSKGKKIFKHNIIFLFNGAEENPLQGAHGFLKHPWAKGMTALVNLDSAGINCKSIVFQVSDPRVVKSYANSVSRPSAQAFGEALFASGIIPSDTDFRIFRDFEQLYGVDIAFSKYGQVYHTRYDSLRTLSSGVLQHSGDMLLALAKEMADSDEYRSKLSEPSAAVYWDYLTLFMFTYDYTIACYIDLFIVFVASASVYYYVRIVGNRFSNVKELLISVCGRFLCLVGGALMLWFIAILTVLTTSQLKYLSNSWVVVMLYWIPFLLGAVTASQAFDAWRSRKSGLSQVRRFAQAMAATRLILLTIVLLLILYGNTATMRYVITLPLLLMSVTSFISLRVIKSCSLKPYEQLILDVALTTPALLLCFVVALKVNNLMAPIMGRSPTLKPDFLVAGLNTGAVVLACLPLSGIELLFSRHNTRHTFVIVMACIIATLYLYPISIYGGTSQLPSVQRHYWFHTEVISYDINQQQTDRQSGIWFTPTDINTPQSVIEDAKNNGVQFRNIKKASDEDCERYAYCNLPTNFPRLGENRQRCIWVDFEPPTRPKYKEELTLLTKECTEEQCHMQFSVIGAPHMSVILWPRQNTAIHAWTVASPVKYTNIHNGRPIYYMFVTRGTYSEDFGPYEFSVDLKMTNRTTTGPLLDVSLVSHRISHDEEFTESYRNLTKSMPKYYNIATYLSRRLNYIF